MPKKPSVAFPDIAPKSKVECQTLLQDQILLLGNIFSPGECKSFVKFIDSLPLELTPPKKRGEAERHNYRHSITSADFAARLYELFAPHMPFEAHSFNSNIRVYKYTESQHFGPHYDDDCRDPVTGAKSQWTLLLYLTGYEDGVKGGETLFYKNKQVIKAPLTRGTALLHRHGRDCLLHEGSPVLRGVKYVLRSDIMFM